MYEPKTVYLGNAIIPGYREEKPEAIVFFDCETEIDKWYSAPEANVTKQKVYLICAHVHEKSSKHYTLRSKHHMLRPETFFIFLRGLSSVYKSIWVVCHNANYDVMALGLISKHDEYGFRLIQKPDENSESEVKRIPFLSLKRGAFSFSLFHGDTEFCFLDSYNWLPASVATIGERIGIPKLDFPKSDEVQDHIDYCHRDVEIIAQAVMGLGHELEEGGMGWLKKTLASTSFSIWRKSYLEKNLKIPFSENVRKQARLAYHGGFVWPYQVGKIEGELFQLDIRSLYPHIMREKQFPADFYESLSGVNQKELEKLVKNHLVVALCEVRGGKVPMPVTLGGRTLYCTGDFQSWLTTPEIDSLLNSGSEIRALRLQLYEAARPFTHFVDSLIEKRNACLAAKDKFGSYLYKLLLNSLYGKFGQKNPKWVYFVDENGEDGVELEIDVDLHTRESRRSERIGKLVRESCEETESYYSHPALAAHVTAYGRIYLQNLIENAGHENVFYVDTDSLLVNRIGFTRLKNLGHVVDGELGKLQLEFVATQGYVYGKKDYELDCICRNPSRVINESTPCLCGGSGKKVRLKGVRKNAEQLLMEEVMNDPRVSEALKKIRKKHNPIVISQVQVDTLSKIFKGACDGETTWRKVIKVISRNFADGEVLENGRTSFFRFSLDDFAYYRSHPKAWDELGYTNR